ncbi:13234_t:CDS:2 [Cetraspora pellucida]|uniref:13234_t:CDS:1 n=1 Tax=Cetraspora pellucida TaxID=1433469 RepID=A0A9N9IAT7_9GLOM|nr:13234_t:CDS:2 [Cetraspora pellucida]
MIIRFLNEIQEETDLERLKDFWVKEIIKFKFTDEDKQKLNELREDRIRELEQTQPEVGRHWFREIQDSRNLTEQQKVALNIKCDKQLKSLSNKQYDKINEEIPEIDTATPNVDTLQQKRKERYQLIEKESKIARYDRYGSQITNFYNNKQVVLLSNDNTLARNIDRLNQTLIENDRIKNDLVNLRKHRYNTLLYDVIENEMKEDNDKQSFEDGEKELLLGYIEKFPYSDYTKTLLDDKEQDQYFIDKSNKQFHSICDIKDVDEFVNNIIKKNYLYKQIKEIFDQEDDVINFSKMVGTNDNEQTFFKKIRPLVKNQIHLNEIDKILGKDDDLEQSDNKKQKQAPRRMKNLREDINIIIPKTKLFLMRQGYQTLDIKICVEEILKLYKAIIIASDKKISFLRSLTITKQHFLDIAFKILIKRDEDLRLDGKIGNIFDDNEV